MLFLIFSQRFLVCHSFYYYVQTSIAFHLIVVNLFGLGVIIRTPVVGFGRKIDTWKLPASRTFLNPKGSKNTAGKPKESRTTNWEEKQHDFWLIFWIFDFCLIDFFLILGSFGEVLGRFFGGFFEFFGMFWGGFWDVFGRFFGGFWEVWEDFWRILRVYLKKISCLMICFLYIFFRLIFFP